VTRPDRRDLGRVFNEVPELYDRVRPAYPDELFADLVAITGMDRRLADSARQAIAAGEPLAADSARAPGPDQPGTLTSRNNRASARRAVSGPDWIVPGPARDASGERIGQYAAVRSACVFAGDTASAGRLPVHRAGT